jgi:hypothetical protein
MPGKGRFWKNLFEIPFLQKKLFHINQGSGFFTTYQLTSFSCVTLGWQFKYFTIRHHHMNKNNKMY